MPERSLLFGRVDARRGTADSALELVRDAATKEVIMTRFRFVSLSLIMAHAPYVIPSGLIEMVSYVIDNVVTWFGG